MGRPSDYSPEMAASICSELAQGKSLRSVCANEDRPAASTVFLWLQRHPEFSEQYTRAKEESSDALAEDMLDIADDKEGDVQRDRLKIDTRKWLASKLKPKKYGEKVGHEHSGPGGGPVTFAVDWGRKVE